MSLDWCQPGKSYLILAEKPSQVRAISQVLPKLKNVTLESLRGHCLRLADLAAYGSKFGVSWLELMQQKQVPFVPKQFRRIPCEDQGGKKYTGSSYSEIIKQVSQLAGQVDAIVLACDPDNEGMALGVELLEYAKAESKILGAIDTSKLDPVSLKQSLTSINKLNWKGMAKAGMARAEYDWSLGINCTIAASVLLGQGETLHVGGVKVPTLRCVVDREKEIENFVSKTFYTLSGTARHVASGAEFKFDTKVDRHTELSKRTAQAIEAHLLRQPEAAVETYVERLGLTQIPPKPYSLADLQLEASTRLRLTPAKTLAIAQQLYEAGLISYPRTDSRYYAQGQKSEVPRIMEQLRSMSDYSSHHFPEPYEASSPIFQDSKVNAHTGLSPTGKLPPALLADQLGVYRLIATRYAIQFMEKYGYNCYALLCQGKKLKNADIQLFSSENVTSQLGWRKLQPWGGPPLEFKSERTIPKAITGDAIRILSVQVKEHQTEPPRRFTEATLVKAMERIGELYGEFLEQGDLAHGIGTAATRANIVDSLLKEQYLVHRNRSDAGTVEPTEKGKRLIQVLPESLSNVRLRADMESKIQAVAALELTPHDFHLQFAGDIKNFIVDIQNVGKDMGLKATSKKREYEPSAKQVSFANSLAKRLKLKIPDSAQNSAKELSQWIAESKEKLDSEKPSVKTKVSMFSEKQRNLVEHNCEDEEILALLDSTDRGDYKAVSNWIGGFLSKRKKDDTSTKDIIIEFADDSE